MQVINKSIKVAKEIGKFIDSNISNGKIESQDSIQTQNNFDSIFQYTYGRIRSQYSDYSLKKVYTRQFLIVTFARLMGDEIDVIIDESLNHLPKASSETIIKYHLNKNGLVPIIN